MAVIRCADKTLINFFGRLSILFLTLLIKLFFITRSRDGQERGLIGSFPKELNFPHTTNNWGLFTFVDVTLCTKMLFMGVAFSETEIVRTIGVEVKNSI